MTTIQTLQEKVSSILSSRYKVTNENNKLEVRFSGYKIAPSQLLLEIEQKAGEEAKKEIAKLCLQISMGRTEIQNKTLEALIQLARWAGSKEDIEAVKGCLNIFKFQHRKESTLFRMCDEVERMIYERELDLESLYVPKANY